MEQPLEESIKVVVRVRPFTAQDIEETGAQSCVHGQDNSITVTPNDEIGKILILQQHPFDSAYQAIPALQRMVQLKAHQPGLGHPPALQLHQNLFAKAALHHAGVQPTVWAHHPPSVLGARLVLSLSIVSLMQQRHNKRFIKRLIAWFKQ